MSGPTRTSRPPHGAAANGSRLQRASTRGSELACEGRPSIAVITGPPEEGASLLGSKPAEDTHVCPKLRAFARRSCDPPTSAGSKSLQDPPTSARFDRGQPCPAHDFQLRRPPSKTTRRKPTRKKLSDPIRTAFFIHSAYSAAPSFATPVRPAAPPYSISRRLIIAWVIVSSSTYSSSSPKPMPRAIEVIRNPSKRRRRLMR